MKRYVSIDILKGFCIFLVITFHVLTRTLNMSIIENALGDFSFINLPFYFIIVILGYISQFDEVFICISTFSNIFSVQQQWDQKINVKSSPLEKKIIFRRIMKTQLIRSGFIAFLGYFSEWFLNGMIVDLVSQKENWVTSSIGAFFFAQILTVMALNNVILSFIYLFMLRREKSNHIPIMLLCFLVGFVAITPGIIELLKLSTVVWNNLQIDWEDRSIGMNILVFVLTPFVQRHTPIFPNFSVSSLGALIAYKFSKEGIKKQFLNWLVICSMTLQLGGVCFAYFEKQGFVRFQIYNLGSFLLSFSGSVLFILFFVYFFELRGNKTIIKYTKFWRRLGIFTLSLWCMQWLIILPASLVQVIINWITGAWTKFVDSPLINNGLSIWQFLIALVFIIGFYYGILLLWEKIHYVGTFEWQTIQLISKSHDGAKNRLDMQESLYNVESFIPERIYLYKWWHLLLVFMMFFGFAIIHAIFYLI